MRTFPTAAPEVSGPESRGSYFVRGSLIPLHTVALGLLICALSGCGGGTVSGQVTLDGQPLTKGDISFAPTSAGPAAAGQINSSGNYTLRVGTNTSIPPGSYRVTIMAVEPVAPTPEHLEPLPKLLTPARYNNADSSGFTADVKAGANKFDFNLISAP